VWTRNALGLSAAARSVGNMKESLWFALALGALFAGCSGVASGTNGTDDGATIRVERRRTAGAKAARRRHRRVSIFGRPALDGWAAPVADSEQVGARRPGAGPSAAGGFSVGVDWRSGDGGPEYRRACLRRR
jgi:hypothetical protein